MNATQILSHEEICAVIDDLRRRALRSENSRQNLALFRLLCCCGLRSCEARGLTLGDIALGGPRPAIRIRAAITKRHAGKSRARIVPLWWDAGTREDLTAWRNCRLKKRAGPADPFICHQQLDTCGQPCSRKIIEGRWWSCLRILGDERRSQLSPHCGRHSFCTHAIRGGRSLMEVRDAAGHANISTTSIYLWAIESGDAVPDLFGAK